MATVDGTSGGNTGISERARTIVTIQRTITITDLTFSSATDLLQVMDVPLGFYAIQGLLKITTAGTNNATMTVGDEDDPNGYLTSNSFDAVANLPFDGAYCDASTGKFYAAADTIDMQFAGAQPAAGVFTLYLIGLMTVS